MKIAMCFLLSLGYLGCLAQTDSTAEDYSGALKRMFDASGTAEVFEVAVTSMIESQKIQYSEIPDEFWSEFEREMTQNSMNDLIEKLIPVYEKHLTAQDLETITNFYRSPVGQKLAEKTPLITQEAMQVGQVWGMEIGTKIVEKISSATKE